MRNNAGCLALVAPLCFALAGCVLDLPGAATSSVTEAGPSYSGGDLASLTYRAADLMLASASGIKSGTPLLVSSISNIEDISSSSALGNLVSDFIRTRLVQKGHPNSEVRLRSSLSFNKGQGEFMLSRDPHALLGTSQAAAIVTGTYAVSYNRVYVSLKLVSATDAQIISGADFVVPLQEVAGLLPGQNT